MDNRSRIEYSIINMLTSLGGYILNVLLSFACRIVFTHQMSADYLGVNGLFSSILSMLSLAELGIGTAMIYELYKPVAEKNQRKIASYMKVYGTAYKVIGCLVALIGVALMPFLKFIINEPPDIPENIYLLYLLFLFSTASSYFFSYRSSILMANQKNYIVVAISYAVVIIQDIAQIIVLVVIKSYIAYLILQVVFVFLTNVLISRKAVKDYPYIAESKPDKLTKDELWGLAKNIKALTVTKLSGILVNNTDNIVITYFNGLITTGIISNYLLLITTLTSLVNQVFTSVSTSVGNLNAIGDEEHKYKVFKVLNLANFWIYGWVSIGIIVLSNDIVWLSFGESYVMSEAVPLILAINFYMLGMQSVIGVYKSTMGLFKHGQYILILTAVLNLMGDIILGKAYGVIGIFVATAISRLLTNTWYEPFIIYKFGFKRDFKQYIVRYLGFLFLLAFTCLVSYILCLFVRIALVPRLVIKTVICFVVPNLIFLLVFRRWEEFQFFIELLRRIKAKVKKFLKRI